MTEYVMIFSFLAAVLCALLYLRERRNTALLCSRLDEMLSAAADGNFSVENHFDESRLSRIETEFADYLKASKIISNESELEKDRIKTLIADISHQTKTPIANLVLYSELLEETPMTDDQREDADAIHQQALRLRFLIDALVKLSRLENGIIHLSPRAEKTAPMLRDVAAQMNPKAEGKGLRLVFDEPQDDPELAAFDPRWTAEAIGNIVDNAIKYTDAGEVRISCHEYELFVRIDIADTGIGIPEEEMPKIFGRFYRSKRSGQTEGVGLGLYLAREIISSEGGYIKVDSTPGSGSVFSVFLPKTS